MPFGAVNAGMLSIGSVVTDTGGQFNGGFNGENASDADWIGNLNPVTDHYSGIKSFENRRTVDVNIICAPQDNISMAVMSQLADTCNKINAASGIDVPAGLNGRQAIDWHNGHLSTQKSQGRLDSQNVGCFWNWAQRTNRFGETKLCPPTVFWLNRAGYVFNSFAPWYAIAGEQRGYLQDVQLVQFDEVSEDTLQAMQGNGNSVNPILNIQNRYYIYGERTMQRADRKLTAMHSVICVNWVVNGLAGVARRFVFDPNDAELLDNLNLAFRELLESVKNDRGLEFYSLNISASAENRNNREVVVDIALIPTDVAERIYINATVFESGATVNNIS
jgi:phage tail sheath protein FI